jgi:predicted transcriptional regulator
MKERRRTFFDIISEILRFAEHGALFTQIMYGCELSYSQTASYVRLLLGRGLLRAEDQTKVWAGSKRNYVWFTTTELGKAYVQLFDRLKKMLEGEKVDRILNI